MPKKVYAVFFTESGKVLIGIKNNVTKSTDLPGGTVENKFSSSIDGWLYCLGKEIREELGEFGDECRAHIRKKILENRAYHHTRRDEAENTEITIVYIPFEEKNFEGKKQIVNGISKQKDPAFTSCSMMAREEAIQSFNKAQDWFVCALEMLQQGFTSFFPSNPLQAGESQNSPSFLPQPQSSVQQLQPPRASAGEAESIPPSSSASCSSGSNLFRLERIPAAFVSKIEEWKPSPAEASPTWRSQGPLKNDLAAASSGSTSRRSIVTGDSRNALKPSPVAHFGGYSGASSSSGGTPEQAPAKSSSGGWRVTDDSSAASRPASAINPNDNNSKLSTDVSKSDSEQGWQKVTHKKPGRR